MRIISALILIICLAVLARSCFFTVGPTEYVYLTQFGQEVATYDGSDADQDAGLHICWPWPIQSVQRVDRRLQYFDLPPTEDPTRDESGVDQMLLIEVYVCWKIPDKKTVSKFLRRVGTSEQARAILTSEINGEVGAEISRISKSELINTEGPDVSWPTALGSLIGLLSDTSDLTGLTGAATTLYPGRTEGRVEVTMNRLRNQVISRLKDNLLENYGIELVDVRLRRFYHPPQVRQSIFERIKSERQKKAEEYRSEGEKARKKILSEAEEKSRTMVAEAKKFEQIKKGEAETTAIRIRNEAQVRDPEFYFFLKQMDNLQNILGEGKSVLLLSTQRKLFDLLFQPPATGTTNVTPSPSFDAPPKENQAEKRESAPNAKSGELQ